MPKNTYNNLKLALEEKGYWTPLDERRTDKDVVVESVRKKQERERVLKEFETRLQKRKIVKDGEGERCSSYALIEDMLDECSDNPKYSPRSQPEKQHESKGEPE